MNFKGRLNPVILNVRRKSKKVVTPERVTERSDWLEGPKCLTPGQNRIFGRATMAIAKPTKFTMRIAGLNPVRFFVLLVALTGLAACGVKTAPYPEAATLPSKVEGLSQTISEGGELILTWKPPKTNMVGRPLASLGGFDIEVADNVVNDDYCLSCPHQYVKVDRLPALTPPPGLTLAPGPYTWRYPVKEGHIYHVKVTGVSKSGGRHPQATSETVVWALPAPGDLGGFSAAMADRAVNLSWAKPAPGYTAEIMRMGADNNWAPLESLDPAAGHFVDLKVEYENTYTYRGRLVRLKDDSQVTGPWSREIVVAVIDVTPPNPPGYLDAALTEAGVKLSWESGAFDPDLAGYRVYRQLPDEDDFQLLSPSLLKNNTFVDPIKMKAGAVARYRVTAVDGSRRANESLPSPVASVLLDPPVEPSTRPDVPDADRDL